MQNHDEYHGYKGCIVLVWDNDAGRGFYAIVGDYGAEEGKGEILFYLGQQLSPGNPFENGGIGYSLDGNYTFFIVPESNIRNIASPPTINQTIHQQGYRYFWYEY